MEQRLQVVEGGLRCVPSMDDLIKDFLQESRENLDRLDQEFVKLESDPNNLELLKSIFRTIHTIKGTCGFLGFTKLEALTHAGENLLSLLREGELQLSAECTDVLLEMVDATRGYLHEIEKSEVEGETDTSALIAKLKKLQEGAKAQKSATPAPSAPAGQPPDRAVRDQKQNQEAPGVKETAASSEAAPNGAQKPRAARQRKSRPEILPDRIGGALICKTEVRREDVVHSLEMQEAGDKRELGEILVAQGAVSKNQGEEVARESKTEEVKDATIRVDVNLLEKHMNLVSELVLLRNRLLQLAAESNERNLNATVHGLNYVTSELRKNVMKTRMQPVSQLFDKLARIVRDVSKDMGKKVRLETQGGGTELDKTLLESSGGNLRLSTSCSAPSPEPLVVKQPKSTRVEEPTLLCNQVNDISGTIATAVEEQSATSSEMSRNISEAAKGVGEVVQNIRGVAQAAQSTSHGATDSQKGAKSLAEMSTHLRELVGRFRLETGGQAAGRSYGNRTSRASQRAVRAEQLQEELAVR